MNIISLELAGCSSSSLSSNIYRPSWGWEETVHLLGVLDQLQPAVEIIKLSGEVIASISGDSAGRRSSKILNYVVL
jgi:hypothetical protein